MGRENSQKKKDKGKEKRKLTVAEQLARSNKKLQKTQKEFEDNEARIFHKEQQLEKQKISNAKLVIKTNKQEVLQGVYIIQHYIYLNNSYSYK